MPDGAHLFRGIHDADMVRKGLTISTQETDSSVDLVVLSTGVGHRFPTYSVARIRLTAASLGSSGRSIPDGNRELTLQRRMSVENGNWIELSDTRLAPGESVTLTAPRKIGGICADKIAFQIIVEPEWYYHSQVYPTVIEELEAGHARDQLIKAKSESLARQYVLYDAVVPNNCDDSYQPDDR